jgi:ferredoxin
VRLVLDTARCQGHGRCYDLAPAIVDADDEGRAVLLDGAAELTPETQAMATAAVRNCPEQALRLEG